VPSLPEHCPEVRNHPRALPTPIPWLTKYQCNTLNLNSAKPPHPPSRPPPLSHLRTLPNPLTLPLALRARSEPCHRLPTAAARSTIVVELPAVSVAPVSSALSPATRNTLRFTPNPSGPPSPRSSEFLRCSRSSATVAPSSPCASVVASRL
jgi:hypothetical protein